MKEKLKSLGALVVGIAAMFLICVLIAFFFRGAAWVSERVLPILSAIGAITFIPLILIVLPLSIFRKCRPWCAFAFVGWSYLCGLCLWMTSLLLTINLWGYGAAIIGLLLGGFGVFPIAVLACTFKGEWSLFFQLILQFVFLCGARLFGFYLAGKSENEIIEQPGIATLDAFDSAVKAVDAGLEVIQPLTTRANHRFEISNARHDLTLDQESYDEINASYTEPEDFTPYTVVELDAHTAAMANLATNFDALTDAFKAFNHPDANIKSKANELYKAYCENYKFAADAYLKAALCALVTASEGNLQAVKDNFQTMLLDRQAENSNENAPTAAKAKAVDFRVEADAAATKATVLEQKARIAETKAKELLAKVEAKCS